MARFAIPPTDKPLATGRLRAAAAGGGGVFVLCVWGGHLPTAEDSPHQEPKVAGLGRGTPVLHLAKFSSTSIRAAARGSSEVGSLLPHKYHHHWQLVPGTQVA